MSYSLINLENFHFSAFITFPGSLCNGAQSYKFSRMRAQFLLCRELYDTSVCYLLHLSMAVLCFIDFCIALHNCSNPRVRYDVTCKYFHVGYICR